MLRNLEMHNYRNTKSYLNTELRNKREKHTPQLFKDKGLIERFID